MHCCENIFSRGDSNSIYPLLTRPHRKAEPTGVHPRQSREFPGLIQSIGKGHSRLVGDPRAALRSLHPASPSMDDDCGNKTIRYNLSKEIQGAKEI